MTSSTNQRTNFNDLAISLPKGLIDEIIKLNNYDIENKNSVAKMARKIMVECDDLDEDLCLAVDYLQCQIEHASNQHEILSFLQHQQRFNGEIGDLRHEFRDLRERLLSDLRYGKRTEEIDKVLTHLSTITMLANQMPAIQPIINFAGIEKALSPRCTNCTDTCRSAFRRVQVFLRKLIKACESNTSNAKS